MTLAVPFSWSAAFVVNNVRAEIVVASDTLNTDPRVSFTGTFDGSGQIVNRLREAMADIGEAEEVTDLCDAWDALHLKRVSCLDADQMALLESVKTTLLLCHGERYGTPAAFEDIADADFSNADDTLDSRDIIKRIEELAGAFAAAGLDPRALPTDASDDARARAIELAALRSLEKEGEDYAPDWLHGETLIRESYFEDYAEEIAKDTGELPREIPAWIAIDWAKTAENLKVDYTEVDFDGVTYLIR